MSAQVPTLSLCMIVRDAERSLAQALASVKPFAEELIVVDTGSTDTSREIAHAADARVFDFPWCDNFAAARNYSLEQATGDWILWIDADDELPAASAEEIRRLIEAHPMRDAAFWATVEETVPAAGNRPARTMGHEHVKLFPRHSRIRFRYRIHEQIAPAIRMLNIPIKRSSIVIRHAHADRSPTAERARLERNLRLARLDLQEHPDDPFVTLSLGTTYLFMPDGLPRAVDLLQSCVKLFRPGTPSQLNAYLYLGQALGTLGDVAAEEQVYREALEIFPDDVSLLLRLGMMFERSGMLQQAAGSYTAALQKGRVRLSAVHMRNSHAYAVLRLGEVYLRLGQRPRAERMWQKYLERRPEAASIRAALHKSYLSSCSIIVKPSK